MFVKPEHRRSCHHVATLALLSSAFGLYMGGESFAAGLSLGGGRGLGASATAAAAGLGASVGVSVGGASRGATTSVGVSSPAASGSVGSGVVGSGVGTAVGVSATAAGVSLGSAVSASPAGATTSVGVSSPAASGSVGSGLGSGVVGSGVGTAVGVSATAAGVSLGGAVSASPAGATANVGVSSPAAGNLGVGGAAGLGGVGASLGVSGSGLGAGVSAGVGGGQGLGVSVGGSAAGASVGAASGTSRSRAAGSVGAASGTSRSRAAASVGVSSATGVSPGIGAGMPSGPTDGGTGSMAGATGSRGIGASPSGGLSAVSRRQTWSGMNDETASYGYADTGYPSFDIEETGPVAVYIPDVPALDQSRYDRLWRRRSSAQEVLLPRCTHNHCTTFATRGSGVAALRAERVLFLNRAERPLSRGSRGPRKVVMAGLGSSAGAAKHASELRAGKTRQNGAFAARNPSSPGGAHDYGRASPERLAPKAAPIPRAGKSLARGVLVASLGPAGTAASDNASANRPTNNALFVPTPIPVAEKIVSGKEVELLWSSKRPSEPVKFFVEMRVLGSAGSHEVYSSFTDRSSIVASVPVARGEYAWRVSAVAPHAGRYATSQWLRFKVRP